MTYELFETSAVVWRASQDPLSDPSPVLTGKTITQPMTSAVSGGERVAFQSRSPRPRFVPLSVHATSTPDP